MTNTVYLSRELMTLAMEAGVEKAAREYIEGTFAAQFPGLKLRLDNVIINVGDCATLDIRLGNDFEVEFIE